MAELSKTRREVITEFRRTEILRAARSVFAAHGFSAATMDLIAAEAGIAKGTLYLYFPGKDDIFWAAIESRLRELLERTRQELTTVAGAREKLRRALQVRFAFLHSDEQFLRMYFTEFGQLCRPTAHFQPAFRAVYTEAAAFLADVIEQGIRGGEIRPLPPLETAMALMDLSRDVFVLRFLDVRRADEAFDGEQFVFDLFWNGIASQPAPAGAVGMRDAGEARG